MNEQAVVIREVVRPTNLGDPNTLPKIGEWFWVKCETDDSDCVGWTFSVRGGRLTQLKKRQKKRKVKGKFVEELMCVQHIASNHVQFKRYEGDSGWTMQVGFQELLTDCRPAPEWRKVLEDRMEQVRLEIQRQTRLLYEEGQKADALPLTDTTFVPKDESSPLSLALRTVDPAIQKKKLIALQKHIPEVTKSIGELAKHQAGLSKSLMLSELVYLGAMTTQLKVVEDKIFTLEVYAGMQEQVKQIGEGVAAQADTKITIRQSLLFMDEETLFDYNDGGMDFQSLGDFDKWVAKPENLNRVMPEPRGVVAFRVRREHKDYGPSETLSAAWIKMEMNMENMKTYLLLRNGDRIFRIASAVDFSPRLIPLRGEFDNAFVEEHRIYGWYNHAKKTQDKDRIETRHVTPQDFDYDDKVFSLKKNLKHYNRIVVLLQGLLDRSEVYHPHPPINLASEQEMDEWVNLVRDEEDVLGTGSLVPTWEQYRALSVIGLRAGDMIHSRYWDGRKRPYNIKDCPSLIEVKKVRRGNKGDVVLRRYRGYARSCEVDTEGRKLEECLDIEGVEVEWDGGERYSWRSNVDRPYTGHMWIPMTAVFNVNRYKLGDYKKFLCDRTLKGAYLKWAPSLLTAEDWHRAQIKKRVEGIRIRTRGAS